MEPVRLRAWEPELVELDAEVAQAIKASGLVRVELERTPSTWRLVPDSRVGVALGPDWELRVEPRLDVPKLMFLLGYARDPNGWRDFVAPMAREEELFSAVASGFAAHARRAIEGGVLRGYVTVDEGSAVLRGRLRVADQIAIHAGLPLPAEIRYDDYSIDVAENRLLAAASTLLLRLQRIPELARTHLRRVRGTLAGISPPQTTDAPAVTRLTVRYAPAMALAELILKGLSISTRRGEITSSTFMFDMNKVFEEFLETALTEALRPYGGRVEPQLTGHYLDRQQRLAVRPDITWWKGSRIAAVADAKYKPIADNRFPNADAYQMLAYCSAFGLKRGFLVYAKGEADDRTHALPHGIDLRVFTVDVENEPAVVLRQVCELATALAMRQT